MTWADVHERLATVGYASSGEPGGAPVLSPDVWRDILIWALIGQMLAGKPCACKHGEPISADCPRHGKAAHAAR